MSAWTDPLLGDGKDCVCEMFHFNAKRRTIIRKKLRTYIRVCIYDQGHDKRYNIIDNLCYPLIHNPE